MYTHRTLESFVRMASAQFGAVLLTGPRQVGKTTMLRALSEPTRQYISMDDTRRLASLAKTDPTLFLERFKPPLLIDEI